MHDPDRARQLIRQRTLELLKALAAYGVIDYCVSAQRRGERGPHVDIWKGPRFEEGLPEDAPAQLQQLFADLHHGSFEPLQYPGLMNFRR